MSLMKWTLAMAGTAMGLRYLSDRHRRRIADGNSLGMQTDRDDARDMVRGSSGAPWSPSQGGTTGLGVGAASTGSTGSSMGSGTSPGLGGAGSSSAAGEDNEDLLSPGSSLPGGNSPRF